MKSILVLISFVSSFASAAQPVSSACAELIACQLRRDTPINSQTGQPACEPADDILIDIEVGEVLLETEDEVISVKAVQEAPEARLVRMKVAVEGDSVLRSLLIAIDRQTCDVRDVQSENY